MPAIPKPEPRSRIKRRKQREEAAVIRRVRAACVERDGYCRLKALHRCDGPSEWAHAHSHRRSKTRGLPPEQRHDARWTLMLCKRAHEAYDAKRLSILAWNESGSGFNGFVCAIGNLPQRLMDSEDLWV